MSEIVLIYTPHDGVQQVVGPFESAMTAALWAERQDVENGSYRVGRIYRLTEWEEAGDGVE